MSVREEAMARHPDFPWLEAGDAEGIDRVLHGLGWLEPDEHVERAEPAGEGNMNLTLRVKTGKRSFVLKQARPWVEKYPEIAAPWERSTVEQAFYARAAKIPGVAQRMPRLIAADTETRLLALEDLPGARDLSELYADPQTNPLDDEELGGLALYLARLHEGGSQATGPRVENRAMRELNHAHIYSVPLDPHNGLDLDMHEPGLGAAARTLMGDSAFCAAVRAQGERYLGRGQSLLHGDFFPGSWLRTDVGLRIIDPEFSFPGEAEFDLGCAVAHFALMRLSAQTAGRFLDDYSRGLSAARVSQQELARNAAIEVMRRLIGVAQLPIPKSEGWRTDLLGAARRALLDARLEELFL